MHPGRVLVLALAAGAFLGCAPARPAHSPLLVQSFRPSTPPVGPDVVQMDVALVQVPIGDPSLDGGLWAFIDEQVVALEKKAVLEDNGFRVGQVSASPPPGLLELLTQERTCPKPRRLNLPTGKASRPLELGPPRARLRFRLRHGGDQATAVDLKRAQCGLLVVPTLTEDGRIHLVFTPQVQHAVKGLMPWRPRADRSDWALQLQDPVESYDALGWEVTVTPGEYIVIGARPDSPDTLGHATFVRTDEPAPVQRLLVLRTARLVPEADFPPYPGPGVDAGATPRSPPLALQAGWSSARGVAP